MSDKDQKDKDKDKSSNKPTWDPAIGNNGGWVYPDGSWDQSPTGANPNKHKK